MILAVAAIGIGYYALVAPPQALGHVTKFSVGSGTGREDLWRVAIQMFKNHPLNGVGTGNFQVVEPRYALRNINLPRVDLVVDTPKVAHNTYLHVLTELGVVGIRCLRRDAARRARRSRGARSTRWRGEASCEWRSSAAAS